MDKSSLIRIILGILAVGMGMVLKGISLGVFINPTAILIIIVGKNMGTDLVLQLSQEPWGKYTARITTVTINREPSPLAFII